MRAGKVSSTSSMADRVGGDQLEVLQGGHLGEAELALWDVAEPRLTRALGLSLVTSSPSSRTFPDLTGRRPTATRRRVVFPARCDP